MLGSLEHLDFRPLSQQKKSDEGWWSEHQLPMHTNLWRHVHEPQGASHREPHGSPLHTCKPTPRCALNEKSTAHTCALNEPPRSLPGSGSSSGSSTASTQSSDPMQLHHLRSPVWPRQSSEKLKRVCLWAVDQNPCCRGAPPSLLQTFVAGPLLQTLVVDLCVEYCSLQGAQNTPVCFIPLSRNGRPSLLQGQCF